MSNDEPVIVTFNDGSEIKLPSLNQMLADAQAAEDEADILMEKMKDMFGPGWWEGS